MSAPKPMFLNTRQALKDYCRSLEGETILALDSEFIREKSYVPKLEIVQVASRDGRIAIIDYAAIGAHPGDPFVALLENPGILKVFHAADQDLEMLHQIADVVVGPIWDTQLVTGLFGYAGRLGYAAVVESLLNEKPVKGETLTDWSMRPLSPEQLHYAAEDVRFLLALYDVEKAKLEGLGRYEWATEECERLRSQVEKTLECRKEDATLYQRVRGGQSLDRRGLAILRELAIWREDEAYKRNRPRGSVMKDEMLVEIARRAPNHLHQLKALRGLQPRDLERVGDDLMAAVRAGKQIPPEECPTPEPQGPFLDEAGISLASLLQAVLQALAAQKQVAPGLVATNGELQRLVEAFQAGKASELPVLTGWRGSLIGQELLEILKGTRAVRWDPSARRLLVSER